MPSDSIRSYFDSVLIVNSGALKTQVQHFVWENVAWEKVTTNLVLKNGR